MIRSQWKIKHFEDNVYYKIDKNSISRTWIIDDEIFFTVIHFKLGLVL